MQPWITAKQLNRRWSWKIQRYYCLCIWVYQHVQIMLVAPIIIFIDRFSKVYPWRSRSRPRRAVEEMIQPLAVVSTRCFMNSTAFCSRVVLSLDSTLWWSVKFIIHTWLAFYLILVRRSCCNLSTIEIIFFFLIRVIKICLSPWQFCMGSTEIDVFPKHSDPFLLNCSCFLFYLQLKSVKFCEVGKNTCAPVGAILTVLGMFSLPHSILGTGCWLWAKLSAFAN